MYHRFVMKLDKLYPDNQGLLSYTTGLWTSKKSVLTKEQDTELGTLIKWFNGYLRAPKEFKIDVKLKSEQGIFWFKDDKLRIDKAIELKNVVTKFGHEAVYIQSEDVGEIIAEDKFQVVAKFNRRVKWEIIGGVV